MYHYLLLSLRSSSYPQSTYNHTFENGYLYLQTIASNNYTARFRHCETRFEGEWECHFSPLMFAFVAGVLFIVEVLIIVELLFIVEALFIAEIISLLRSSPSRDANVRYMPFTKVYNVLKHALDSRDISKSLWVSLVGFLSRKHQAQYLPLRVVNHCTRVAMVAK